MPVPSTCRLTGERGGGGVEDDFGIIDHRCRRVKHEQGTIVDVVVEVLVGVSLVFAANQVAHCRCIMNSEPIKGQGQPLVLDRV